MREELIVLCAMVDAGVIVVVPLALSDDGVTS